MAYLRRSRTLLLVSAFISLSIMMSSSVLGPRTEGGVRPLGSPSWSRLPLVGESGVCMGSVLSVLSPILGVYTQTAHHPKINVY